MSAVRSKKKRARSASLKAVSQFIGQRHPGTLLALAGAVAGVASLFHVDRGLAGTYTWASGDTTGLWNSTSSGTDWNNVVFPNAAGDIATYTSTTANGTVTLNTNATIGQIVASDSGKLWTIANSGTGTLTLDNTSGITNGFGNGNAAISVSAGVTGTLGLQVNSGIVIANTDLDVGSVATSSAGLTLGASANAVGITATSARNLTFRNNSTTTNALITVNDSIGLSGSTINISNIGTGTQGTTLAGTLGSSVGSVTQSAASSTLTLSGTNSYAGGTFINAGTLNVSSDGNLGSTAAANNITLNGGKLNATANITLNANHGMVIGAGGGTFTGTSTLTFGAGMLSGSGTLTVNGGSSTASVLNSGGTQSFSGPIAIVNGRIILNAANITNPYGTGAITVGAGTSSVYIQQSGSVWDNSFNIAGNGGEGRGVIRLGASGTYNGNVALTANAGLSADAAVTSTFNGNFSGAFQLQLGGLTGSNASAVYVLNGTNSQDTTLVAGGTVLASKPSALSGYTVGGKITVNNGATLAVKVGGANDFSTADLDVIRSTVKFNTSSMLGIDTSNAASSVTYGSNVSNTTYVAGTLGITKMGVGTLILSGTNTYTGATTVMGGTLAITGTLGNTAVTVSTGTLSLQSAGAIKQNTVTVQGTGQLVETVTNAISGSTTLTLNGGTTTLSNANNYTGITNFNAATLIIGNNNALGDATTHTSQVSVNGAGILQASTPVVIPSAVPFSFGSNWTISGSNSITINGEFTNYGGGRTVTSGITGGGNALTLGGTVYLSESTSTARILTFNGSGTTTITGVIANAKGGTGQAGGLIYSGTGVLNIAGTNNTYTGVTTVTGGTLVLSGNNTTSGITVSGGTNSTVTITNLNASGSGVISLSTGATTPFLNLHINGGGTINLPNTISGNSGLVDTIDVNNNGSGSNGVIVVPSMSLGTATLNVTGGNGYSLSIPSVRNTAGTAGTMTFNPTTAVLSLGNLTGTQATGTNTWALSGTNTGNTVTGVISDSSTGAKSVVTKSGSGTWTLSSASTYTGATTVTAGTLNITGSLGNTAVTVNGGALQLGNGGAIASAALTLNAGSTLQLRAGSSTTFTAASVATVPSGTLNIDVANNGSGTNNKLTLGNALTWAGNATPTINVTGANGYDLVLGALSAPSSSGGPYAFTVNATSADVTIGSFTAGSYGSALTFVGLATATLNSFVMNSNGNDSIVVNGANVVLAGANSLSGSRTGGAFGVTLTSGTLNVNNAGAFTNSGSGTTPTFTINGGTLDNTSTGSITMAANATQSWNGDFTFGGSNALNLGTGAVALGASRQVTVDGSGALTVGGVISGTNSYTLTKAGTGTLVLSGANSFTGVLTVQRGTLAVPTMNNVSAAGPLGNSTNTVTLGGSGTTGVLEYTGTTASSSKPLAMATGGAGEIQVDVSTATLTLSGLISGSGNLIKDGLGTLALSNSNNSYSGKTTVTGGTLSVNSIGNVGAGSSALGAPTTVANGTIDLAGGLTYTGAAASSNRAINLTGNSTITNSGSGALTLSGGLSGSGNIAFRGTQSITESGLIATGAGNLTRTDAGTLYLTNTANSFTGVVQVSTGTINTTSIANSGVNSALGAGSQIKLGQSYAGATVGTLQFSGASGGSSNRDIVINNGAIAAGGVIENTVGSQTLTLSGSVTAASTSSTTSLTLQGIGNGVLSGSITGSPSMSLIKMGSGTWTLSGTNTYTGTTTVSGGTLIAGSAGALGVGAITVQGTGQLLETATNAISGSNTLTITAGGTVNLSKANSGFSGATALNAATLILGNNSALGTSREISINGAGVIQAGAANISTSVPVNFANSWSTSGTNSLTLNGLLTSWSTGLTVTNSISGSGTLTVKDVNLSNNTVTHTLTIGGAGTTTITGVVANGGGSTGSGLAFNGSGSLTLLSINTYTGATTISNGTLLLSGSSSINSSSGITVNGSNASFVQNSSVACLPSLIVSQGTVNGTGRVSQLTIGDSPAASVASGNGTSGTLTVDNLTFNGAGAFKIYNNSTLSVGTLKIGAVNSTAPVVVSAGKTSWNTGSNTLFSYTNYDGSNFANLQVGAVRGLAAGQTILGLVNNPTTKQVSLQIGQSTSNVTKLRQDYLDMGYGMFLHFNMATFGSGDWAPAGTSVNNFNPTNLNIESWATTAKAAGMKYAVLTTKHEGGFALWDTNQSSYDVASSTWYANETAAGRNGDVVKRFADAFRNEGLGVCLYYTIRDTTNGLLNTGKSSTEATNYIENELHQLLTNYGPVKAIWTDAWGWASNTGYTYVDYNTIYNYIKAVSPNTLLLENNHKYSLSSSDLVLYESGGWDDSSKFPLANTVPSEICRTIRADGQWFYHSAQSPTNLRPATSLASEIRFYNARECNYLLDVTPDRTGNLPVQQVELLSSVKALLDRTNLAMGKPTTQSTTFVQSGTSLAAGNAVDGVRLSNSSLLSHTNTNDANPWWQVDLGGMFDLTDVLLYNRLDGNQDRFRDMLVKVFDADNHLVYTSATLNPNNILSSPDMISLGLPEHTLGRYVMILKDLSFAQDNYTNGYRFLAFSEVEVNGTAVVPEPGSLGLLSIGAMSLLSRRPGRRGRRDTKTK